MHRIVARAVAEPVAAALLGMPALGTAPRAGAAFAITPAPAQVSRVFVFAPGSTEPKRGHEAFVALAFDLARWLGWLDRSRGPDARPAWLMIVGHAPGDAVLAAQQAVAVRGALLRAGVAPERVVLLEPNQGPALPELPDGVEVVLCPAIGGPERWPCAPP